MWFFSDFLKKTANIHCQNVIFQRFSSENSHYPGSEGYFSEIYCRKQPLLRVRIWFFRDFLEKTAITQGQNVIFQRYPIKNSHYSGSECDFSEISYRKQPFPNVRMWFFIDFLKKTAITQGQNVIFQRLPRENSHYLGSKCDFSEIF